MRARSRCSNSRTELFGSGIQIAMTPAQLKTIQERGAIYAVDSLIGECRRRYRRAAELLRLHELSTLVADAGYYLTDRNRLVSEVWIPLCDRYRGEWYDPQDSLFCDHDQREERAWYTFVNDVAIPAFADHNEMLRSVLGVVRILPDHRVDQELEELSEFVSREDFPGLDPDTLLRKECSPCR